MDAKQIALSKHPYSCFDFPSMGLPTSKSQIYRFYEKSSYLLSNLSQQTMKLMAQMHRPIEHFFQNLVCNKQLLFVSFKTRAYDLSYSLMSHTL